MLGERDLRQKIENLRPVNGFCVMIDMVGSTELKDRSLNEWILRIGNVFNLARGWVEPKFLKTIGDMLMFWVRDDVFHRTNSPLGLVVGLASMIRESEAKPELFSPLKAAVCRCSGVFEIVFMRPGDDVYGKHIDLTARLVALASEGEVLMNADFRDLVCEQYEGSRGQEDQFRCVTRIQGPWSQKLKGFSKPETIYKLPSPH